MKTAANTIRIALAPLAALATSLAANAGPSLTVYNQNFAVVRDAFAISLEKGVTDTSYSGMTSLLEPDSVILRDPSGKARFQILEQSYRNDPVTQELLLDFFEGKTVDFFIKEPNKPDQTLAGKIIRSGYKSKTQPVIEVDGKLRFSLPGQPHFPSLGDDTILNPTLSWKIESAAAAKFDAELAYVTGGFNWGASYNLVSPEKSDEIDLVGWITINNQSGRTFRDAAVKLMAGDVNKIVAAAPMAKGASGRMMAMSEMAAPVTEKSFDEFHLYTLANKVTLRDKETKQVEFIRATGIESKRLYVYDGALLPGWRPGITLGSGSYDPAGNKKVGVYREFKNAKEDGLGIPLPKGRVRFYRQDDDRRIEFTGENEIDHTAREELVRLYTGDSFDLVGERKQTDFKINEANHWAIESFEIKLRNRKAEPVEIRVVEHLFRWLNWEIRKPSAEFTKKNSQTIEFIIPVAPDEEKVVTYEVRYTW